MKKQNAQFLCVLPSELIVDLLSLNIISFTYQFPIAELCSIKGTTNLIYGNEMMNLLVLQALPTTTSAIRTCLYMYVISSYVCNGNNTYK